MSRNNAVYRVLMPFVAVLAIAAAAGAAAAADFVYDSQGKRNPFIPIVTPDGRLQKLDGEETKADAGFALEGIMYDKYGISYAVVNGIVVKVGDMVSDYQVLRVAERQVILMREGQEKTLELKKEGL